MIPAGYFCAFDVDNKAKLEYHPEVKKSSYFNRNSELITYSFKSKIQGDSWDQGYVNDQAF